MTTSATDVAAFSDQDVPIPLWRQRLKVFMGNKLAIASCIYLVVVAAACFLVPHLHPTNQTNQAIAFGTPQNEPPSSAHWLGTDSNGFDELGRIFFGGEYSLTLGILAGFITIVVGTLYGMIAGFVGCLLYTSRGDEHANEGTPPRAKPVGFAYEL